MAKKKPGQRTHQIRIIAGKWRGQKINVIDQDDLRPTTDRVRETLFNWLALPIVQAQCLDAFTGSGILAFEALSREAKSVVALDNSPRAKQALIKNISHLKADNLKLIEQDTCAYLRTTSFTFDVIFLDPPYAHPNLMLDVLDIILKRDILKTNGLIYIEMAKKDLHMLDSLRQQFVWLKEKSAGQVCYALLSLNE